MPQDFRHPSLDIVETISSELRGRCIALGVTASASIYRALDTARSLMRRGADVRVIMTKEASRLVSPTLFEWATGHKAIVDIGGEIEHVELSRDCSGLLVAPATYSTLSKIAYGIADNPVSLTAVTMMGYGKPVAVVPAMHEGMERSPQYKDIEERLRSQGVLIIPPRVVEGAAKYPNPYLVARVFTGFVLRGLDLKGARVLVTAGATRSWVDRVRFVTNPSSGRMGVEVATEAFARGAEVDLVYGSVDVEIPHFIRSYAVETTEQMADKVRELTSKEEYDVIVGAAAPLDFRVKEPFEGKLKSEGTYTITLEPSPKVLSSIARRPKVLVSFAADVVNNDNELISSAVEKASKYGADLVVANPVNVGSYGFASVYDYTVIVRARSKEFVNLGLQRKEVVARRLLDEVVSMLRSSR
ncbi:MAG: bifunctional phosphopantothenoylcysteine decarboxylase/phosphopantothenate--cysteine ligase CoaBC [Acidilobus sp.]